MVSFIDFIPERVITLYEDIIILICKKLKISSSQATSVFTVFALAFISILLMLITIGIMLYIEMNRRKKSKQCKKVLLVGEANSGKSSLLNKISLLHDGTIVADAKKQSVDIALETNQDIEMKLEHVIIDQYKIPLCEMIHEKWFSSCLTNCTSIIVLIDGTSFSPLSCASFLQSLFNNSIFLKNPLPILFAVNKSDCKNAVHNSVVYSQIEKELGNLLECSNYSFKIYSPCTIYACNCSVQTNSYGLLLDFMKASI